MDQNILIKAIEDMYTARILAELYEREKSTTRYVHSTSRGHEAIQLATAYHLKNDDWVSPYYRDDSMMLGMGFTPRDLMLQLLAKADDPFSAGRSYYCHPSSKLPHLPKIIHQSSATGMQAIPSTGVAQGIKYRKEVLGETSDSIVVCSMGDNSVTEGEVSEAWQFAALHQLPILFLVQDNGWGISVTAEEARTADAYDFAEGFTGLNRYRINGKDFIESYEKMGEIIQNMRTSGKPCVVCAKTVLIGHHTSGVRTEFYRDVEEHELHRKEDPLDQLIKKLKEAGNPISAETLSSTENRLRKEFDNLFEEIKLMPDPSPENVEDYIFAPSSIQEETGTREPISADKIPMVDAGIHAIEEIMRKHPEALLYGQDVGERIGGVFREAVTLGKKFGKKRIFNTAIQEAYIVGSTVGMSAVGLKPIVEIQFADYLYPAINQLVTEISKSCYLSAGKYPVQTLIRVPIGAYGGGGPYHSGSVESMLCNIKGIKVVYPSNAADYKGLMKAAFYDPNPVVFLEHKGLYWSKVPGTEGAKRKEPSEDYIIPLGQPLIILNALEEAIQNKNTVCIITYGMGVYWCLEAAKNFPDLVEIIDLRTLSPIDLDFLIERIKSHGRAMIVSEESINNSYSQALAQQLTEKSFSYLDAPIMAYGSKNTPAIPINLILEKEYLLNAEKVADKIKLLLEN